MEKEDSWGLRASSSQVLIRATTVVMDVDVHCCRLPRAARRLTRPALAIVVVNVHDNIGRCPLLALRCAAARRARGARVSLCDGCQRTLLAHRAVARRARGAQGRRRTIASTQGAAPSGGIAEDACHFSIGSLHGVFLQVQVRVHAGVHLN